MSPQSSNTYTKLAVTVIVVIVLISASLYLSLGQAQGNATAGNTATNTVTSTTTSTATSANVSITSQAGDAPDPEPDPGQLGPWNYTTHYPAIPLNIACVASGGYAYCVGGYNGTTLNNGKGDSNSTYYASLSSTGVGQWTKTTSYPIGIQDESCVTTTGYIYCIGGYIGASNSNNTANVYYAPISSSGIGQWASGTPYPYPFDGRCVTYSSYIYCIGPTYGGTGFNGTKSFFVPLSADGSLNNWTETTGPPSWTAGCSSNEGYIYCFGGGNCPPCSSPSYYAPLSSNGIGEWNSTSQLSTAGFAVYVVADSYLYYLNTPVLSAPLSSSGIGSWNTTTNDPATGPSACISSGDYIYCLGGSINDNSELNSNVYYTQVNVKNPLSLDLQNPPPFENVEYLVPAMTTAGGCSVTVRGQIAGGPCFGDDINEAVIFNCAAAAATASGCTTTVVSQNYTEYNYNITIWYPLTNSSRPDSNCEFLPSLGFSSPFPAWCISIGSNAFIISNQASTILPLIPRLGAH